MNVACTACPAKYAVPDERVRGKRARITCKHCGTSIIVDGTNLGPSDGGSVVAPRPARKTMVGIGQVGAASAPIAASAPVNSAPVNSSPLNSAPSNAPPSGGTAWLVALADGRREPASQARILGLYAAGTIDATTYIWREGMPEWKTPFSIPEIAAALTARGLKPRQGPLFPETGDPEPDEATRVAISVLDDPVLVQARATARPATGARRSQPPPPEDDDGITIARSGPPSSPVSLPPLRRASEPPGASARPQPQGASARPQPQGASARPAAPSAARNAPPSAVPAPSDAPANPRGRPRAFTLPGDLVIPLTGPAAPPPTPLFAPRGQPFAGRRATSSAPPGPSGLLVVPTAPVALTAPPASSAPPPPPAWGAPALAAAELLVAPSAVNLPAPARPLEFEVPPRSAAPVAVPLEFQPPLRRSRALAVVLSLGVLALGGIGFAGYFSSRTTAHKAAAAPPRPSAAVLATIPSAEPAATAPSAEPEPSAPEPSAVPKPTARERAAAPARPAAATRPVSARKAEPTTKAEPGEATSEPTAANDSEGEARTEESPKKAETGASGGTPFDRESAASALSDAALRAGTCRMLGGPTGSAQATVTFAPSGHVSAASVGGDFAGSVVGACIVKLFRGATIPAFSGDPVTVAKRFNIE